MTGAALDRLGRGAGLAAISVPLAAASLPALLATFGAAVVLLVPVLGLVGLAFSVPFGGALHLAATAGALTLTPLLLAWTAVPWVLIALSERRVPELNVPLMVPLAGFLAALGLAAWSAPDLTRAAFEIARWAEMALALLLVVGLVKGRARLNLVLAAILLAGTAAAIVGISMAIDQVGPEAFAILGGRIYRAHGTFGQPNPFGGYMNMVWPLGAGLLLAALTSVRLQSEADPNGETAGAKTAAWPLLVSIGTVAAASAGIALVLSWSRGAWLAAAAGAGAMGVVWMIVTLRPPVDRRRAFAVGLALVCATLVGWAVVGRSPGAMAARLGSVASTFTAWGVADAEVDDLSFATIERVAHWEAAAAMWSDAPWLGQGPGHYEVQYADYRLPRWDAALGHAHNYYLHLLAESGIVGLAAYVVFFGACVILALRACWRPVGHIHFALALGLVGILAALAFHSLVDNLFVHETTVHLGLVLGLLVASERLSTRKRT